MCGGIHAQFIEFGGGFGALNYSGDLSRVYRFTQVRPGLSAHYRMNFSPHISLKTALTAGFLTGSDDKPIDALGQERNRQFNMRIIEIGSVAEYHFLDYRHEKSPIRWSPYAFIGVGFSRLYPQQEIEEDFSRIQAVIPFGIGFKQLIGKRFAADLEIGPRKTFFDLLDGVSDGDLTIKDFNYGNPNDSDWYVFIGLSLSFIIYEIPCPFPYVPNRYMLRANFR
jgi:hypothetical protein